MGFLNQPQQDGPYRVDNSFQKGLQLDTPPDNTPPAVMTGGQNMHLLRQQGSEVLLATEPGMERRCLLPPNHVVHGWAERSGILYLLLAETDATTGQATGRGQLGSFPSPAYAYASEAADSDLVAQGELTAHYRPLRVYYGDFNGRQPTDLISVDFNLSLDAPSELELQDSYDGTLNIIINDRGRNPALLINSGFVPLPPAEDSVAGSPGRYRVVAREGAAQTNRYSRADFKSRLQLFPRGGSLAKAYLLDVVVGGRLPAGSYRYYFTYTDADGNDTDIFAEAGPVEVFEAPTPAQAHGGRPGKATTLSVKLRLEGLDATFGFVRARYVRRSGEPEASSFAAEIDQRFAIREGVCELTHTGQENEQAISAAQLQQAAGSLSTFVTMCQADNRLLLGGVHQDAVDDADLLGFASMLRLGSEAVALRDVPGIDSGSNASASSAGLYQPFDMRSFSGQSGERIPHTDMRANWSRGYLNPLNTCYRLGYMRGESYAFGVRFILDDYSVTETYPVAGIDNLTNAESEENYENDTAAGFYNERGWGGGGWQKQNRNGIYRFPHLNSSGMVPLVEANTNAVNIMAARVQLPEIPEPVRRRAVGLQFMRAPRRPNCIAQGYAVSTIRAMQTSPGGNKEAYDHHHPEVTSILQGNTNNMKVLPALRGILEACDCAYGDTKKSKIGVFPFAFNRLSNRTVAGVNLPLVDDRRLALYVPDALARPGLMLPRFNERDVKVRVLATAYTKTSVRFDNPSPAPGGSWSLNKTSYHQPRPSWMSLNESEPGRTFWTLDNQSVVNGGRFGSQERHLLGKHQNDEKYLINLAWDSYIGLQMTSVNLDATATIASNQWPKNTGYELWSSTSTLLGAAPVASAYLVNLYDATGILSTQSLHTHYSPESLSYVPITQRLSWNEVEEQLDSKRRLLLYGGDTYVGVSYRRIFRALPKDQRREEKFDAPLGQLLSMVCETEMNPYTRSEEAPVGGVATSASFSPLIGASKQRIDEFREPAYYAQPETTRFNSGYTAEKESGPALVTSGLRPMNIPYRAQEFMARVVTTAAAADGSFSNGYRFLPPLSFRDYERQLGRIMRLLPVAENQVLVVHEHGLELLGLNDQALTGQNTAGPVYAEAKDFLPAQGRIIDRHLGIQHPFAVCVTPQGVYGVDAAQGCTWFWHFGAGQVTRLSDFSVSSLLRPVLNTYKGKPTRLQQLDIRVTYDPLRADVLFSLYQKS